MYDYTIVGAGFPAFCEKIRNLHLGIVSWKEMQYNVSNYWKMGETGICYWES
jgi:hypothetical protein